MFEKEGLFKLLGSHYFRHNKRGRGGINEANGSKGEENVLHDL
jgi:hypothetical protein